MTHPRRRNNAVNATLCYSATPNGATNHEHHHHLVTSQAIASMPPPNDHQHGLNDPIVECHSSVLLHVVTRQQHP
jgi:hypothetical protein